MNEYILDAIDQIEINGLFAEMEVCAALVSEYEKQAIILEHALIPSDFDIIMEEKINVTEPTLNKKDDKKEPKNVPKPTESDDDDKDKKKKKKDKDSSGLDLIEDESDEDPKFVWLKKIWEYIKKIALVGVRIIQRMIMKFKKSKVSKVFDSEANKKKVPEEILGLASTAVGIVVLDYLCMCFLIPSLSDNKLYKWIVSTVKKLADPELFKDKFGSLSELYKSICDTQPVVPNVKGNINDFYKILKEAIKKTSAPKTHIPELAEIMYDLSGKLKKYKYELKIEEYREVKKHDVSADRMKNINELLSTLQTITHIHSKSAIRILENISEAVDDGKEVTMAVAIYELDKHNKPETVSNVVDSFS